MIHNIINAVPGTREIFWNTFKTIARTNPGALRYITILMSLYMHLGPFSRRVIDTIDQRIAVLDAAERAHPRAAAHSVAAATPPSAPFNRSTVMSNERRPRGFGHVETWVFDLDNTLYPHHLNLWQQVDERIRAFIADFLKVPHDEAFRVQKDYYKRYGTTMRGLMTEHGLNPDDYLEFVHQIDHSPLEPDPALGAALASCRGASSSSPTAPASMPTR